ncbi:hypothetical protein HNR62_000848 [Oceanisphaera litoralis]|nr:hypothetical protein [Oceanisphaera litoralis]
MAALKAVNTQSDFVSEISLFALRVSNVGLNLRQEG